jgi:hypothetical protein
MIDKKDIYRGYAAECLALAETVENHDRKIVLVDMAMAWLKLAEHAETVGELLAKPIDK